MPPIRSSSDLSEVSSVIGELRNFAAQQSSTNSHMLEELKKIAERMAAFSEMGATFVEYRKTLHERFGKIHEQMGEMDEILDKLQIRTNEMEVTLATWKSNWKVLLAVVYATSAITSAAIGHYGTEFLKVFGG